MASFGYTHRLTQPTFGFIFIVELERGDEEKAWFPHLIVYDLVMWNLQLYTLIVVFAMGVPLLMEDETSISFSKKFIARLQFLLLHCWFASRDEVTSPLFIVCGNKVAADASFDSWKNLSYLLNSVFIKDNFSSFKVFTFLVFFYFSFIKTHFDSLKSL